MATTSKWMAAGRVTGFLFQIRGKTKRVKWID
jgi:hypothetical protein